MEMMFFMDKTNNDTLNGDAGNDTLYGQAGNDTLNGGIGNDMLYGDYGDDVYIYNRGDGVNTIYDYDSRNSGRNGGNETLLFGEGITQDDLILKQVGYNLVVALKEEGKSFDELSDKVVITNFSYNDTRYYETTYNYNARFGIENFEFSDGASWTTADMMSHIRTDGDDVIYGLDGADILEGGKGDDTLYGRLGNDTYVFNRGDGKDIIFDDYGTSQGNSNSGSDTLKLGEGIGASDVVFWMEGANLKVDIGDGDSITINSQSNLNNSIERIELSDGTYVTNVDIEKLNEDLKLYIAENSITINSADDIRANEQMMHIIQNVWRDSDTLSGEYTAPIVLDTNADGITSTSLENSSVYFDYDGDGVREKTAWAQKGDALLAMDLNGDGVINDGSELFGNFTKLSDGSFAKDGYEALAQYDENGDNIIDIQDSAFASLRLWNDANGNGLTDVGELSSLQLSDISSIYLYREDGSTFEQMSEAGNIITNQTDFTTDSSSGIVRDVWFKTDSSDTITDNETYISTSADETFSGGEGNDTYVIKLNASKDIVDDNDLSASGIDTIKFDNGISINQVLVKWDMQTNGLLIGIRENSDDDTALKDLDTQVLIKNWFDAKGKIEKFSFADGTVLEAQDVYSKLIGVKENGELSARVLNDGDSLEGGMYNDVLFGANGNELLTGGDGDDYLSALAGDDKLLGGSGDDVFDGGSGADILDGGSGDDYYIFGKGSGKDIIIDNAGVDSILMGLDITRQDILAKVVGDDITFALKEEGKSFEELSDSITIKNYNQVGFEVEKIVLDDGTTYAIEDLLNQAPILENETEELTLQDTRSITQTLNVTDPDGDTLNYTLKTAPLHGELLFNEEGSFTYSATDKFIGIDSAVVSIDDGNGGVVEQTLNFNLSVSAPTITTVSETLVEDTTLANSLHVNNPIGGELSYEIVEASGNGSFSLDTDGSYAYSPFANYNGLDTVTIKVTNEYGLSSIQTLNLNITPINDAPELTEDTLSYTLKNIRVVQGQVEATDIDGDTLSYSISSQANHGVVSIDEEGNWSYKADGSYNGSDSAIITIDDGNGGVVSQTLNFEIQGYIYEGEDLVIDDTTNDTLDISNLSKDDLSFKQSGDDLLITVLDTNTITLKNYFTDTNAGIDTLLTKEGEINLTRDAINESRYGGYIALDSQDHLIIGDEYSNWLIGNNGNDILLGGKQYDYISGGAGDDILVGGEDNDNLQGNSGDDHLYGDSGNDQLYGGEGSDTLSGGEGADMLFGENGDDAISGGDGNDTIYAGNGDDTLKGGTGDDFIDGSYGSDTYLFNIGDGTDSIVDTAAYGSNDTDTLILGEGITKENLQLIRDNYDLVLQVNDTDSVRVKYWFSSNQRNTLEQITFSDGTTLSTEEVNALALTKGTQNSNWLFGLDNFRDNIYALEGNDHLYSYGGDDFLSGGEGDDFMEGGSGSDTYTFSKGDGADTINEWKYWNDTDIDTISFTQDVSKEDISFIISGTDLLIQYSNEDTIKVANTYNHTTAPIERLELSDGSYLTNDTINRIIQEINAYATDKGMTNITNDTIKSNQDLMQIVSSGWQSA